MGGTCSTHGRVRGEMHTILWLENLKGKGHSGDQGVGREDNIRMDLGKIG
jgi:hypothetical protein